MSTHMSMHVSMYMCIHRYVKKNQKPLWKETVVVPVLVPTMNDFIEFSLWDRDTLSNDRIGTHWFSFKDIQANGDRHLYTHLCTHAQAHA